MRIGFLVLSLIICEFLHAQDFYSLNAVRNINIQFKTRNWDKKLDSLMNDGKGKRLPATVILDGKTFQQVGVRYKGNSSYNNIRNQQKSKLPLNLESDDEIKNQLFAQGISSIKLSNMFRDPSYIREVLAYWLANQLFISPKANFAKVTINKNNLGLYTNTQSIDDEFLKANFGSKKGIFFKCDPNWDSPELSDCPKGDKASLMWQGTDSTCYMGNYELKSKKGYKELVNFISILNKEPDKIDKILDVDKTLWMHAFNHTIVNLDSYSGRLSHNYYLYMDTSNTFVPLVWDMNLAFGGFRMDDKKILTDNELFNYPLNAHSKDASRPLISKILENPLYEKIYFSHCRYIYDNYFANNKLEKTADYISNLIDAEVKKDVSNLYTYNDFKQNLERKVLIGNVPIIGVKELIKERKLYLKSTFKDTPDISIDSVFHTKDSVSINIFVKTSGNSKTFLFYKNQQHPRFTCVQMQEDEKLSASLGGKCFVYHLPAIEKTNYYVVAESEKYARVYPARASNEPIIIQSK